MCSVRVVLYRAVILSIYLPACLPTYVSTYLSLSFVPGAAAGETRGRDAAAFAADVFVAVGGHEWGRCSAVALGL